MGKIKLNPRFKSLHGRIGNVIHYNVYGYQYVRSYSVPRNPQTAAQQKQRAALAEKVKHWQALPLDEKNIYNRIAKGKPLSGYNLFTSYSLRGITHERVMELYNASLAVTILSDRYQLRVTSVYDSSKHACSRIYRFKERLHVKKPPGTAVSAA